MRLAPKTAASIVALMILAGCASDGPANAPAPSDVAATVDMSNTFGFSPQAIYIKAGDTIEWRNKSFMTHTVTDDPQKDKSLSELLAGAAPFDSGSIPSGQVFPADIHDARHVSLFLPAARRSRHDRHDRCRPRALISKRRLRPSTP